MFVSLALKKTRLTGKIGCVRIVGKETLVECEIVDGGCFATVYKYCRTHQCDPDKCPKNEGVFGIEADYSPFSFIDMQAYYNIVAKTQSKLYSIPKGIL